MVSPFITTVCKAGIFTFSLVTTYPSLDLDQIPGHLPMLISILSYLPTSISKIEKGIVVHPQKCSLSLDQLCDYLPEWVLFDDNE